MELFLNLLWLMLALPALLVWRRHSSTPTLGTNSFPRFLVLLGCLLALLFPVVSASDDLHPISAEIEESAASKRTVKHSQSFKSPEWTHDREGAALLVHVASFRPETKTFGAVSEYLPVLPTKAPVIGTIGDRAPP